MTPTEHPEVTTEKLTLELRRGTLVLATLSRLREPRYGYALVQDLGAVGLDVEPGTLYPLLRRLNEQGLLDSSWNVDGTRPRKYYSLSVDGRRVLTALSAQWKHLVEVVDGLLENGQGDRHGTD
jgi:PadR family transcriptional regulator PadR